MLKALFRTLMLAVALAPGSALGQQTALTSGQVWGVTQFLPSGPISEGDTQPSCTLSTRVWDEKGLDFRYVLTGPDYIEQQLLVHSDGWQLPVGRKTDITLMTVAGPMRFNLEATQPNALEGSLDPKVIGVEAELGLRAVLNYVLNVRGRGTGLGIRFAGNEPQWMIPPTEGVESFLTTKMLDRCVADLRRKGAYFYPGGGSADAGVATSPFADGPDTEQSPHPKPTDQMTMTDFANRRLEELNDLSWTFEKTSDEELGLEKICTLNAEKNGIRIGLQATRSMGLSAYVEGFLKSDGKTTWIIDDNQESSIDFGYNDYLDRYVSEELSSDFKNQVLAGNAVDILSGKGDRLMISLAGIGEAARQFEQCIQDEAQPTSAPPASDNASADRLQPLDMAYGGLTIRLPAFIVNAAQNALMSDGKDMGTAFEFDEGSMRRFQLDRQVKPVSALLKMAALNRVTYRVDQPGWAVVSGFPDEAETKIYYGACRKAQVKFVCIDFTYDKSRSSIMDEIVKAASLSLKR